MGEIVPAGSFRNFDCLVATFLQQCFPQLMEWKSSRADIWVIMMCPEVCLVWLLNHSIQLEGRFVVDKTIILWLKLGLSWILWISDCPCLTYFSSVNYYASDIVGRLVCCCRGGECVYRVLYNSPSRVLRYCPTTWAHYGLLAIQICWFPL